MRAIARGTCLLLATALALAPGTGGAAEEREVKASAAWIAQGRFVPSGEGKVFFVGVFTGIMFVDKAEGWLNAMSLVCPGTLEVEINGGRQHGEGRCLLRVDDTHQVFARWSCAGTHQVECTGPFTLVGGTGRFAGITGQGQLRLRTGFAELKAPPEEMMRETAAGLAEWTSLRYRIP